MKMNWTRMGPDNSGITHNIHLEDITRLLRVYKHTPKGLESQIFSGTKQMEAEASCMMDQFSTDIGYHENHE